jgi:ribose/xylose/arabinose/galactoside ABC-type transport system permease subunit
MTATSPSAPKGVPAEKSKRSDWLTIASRFGALIVLIALLVIFSVLTPAFATSSNLFNVLRQVSIYGLLAVGMTFVILTGGIDLSIGSILALAGLVCAAVVKGGTGALSAGATGNANMLIFGVAAALLVGLFAGTLQGLAVAKLKVPAFIVTLGGLSVFRGAALVFSNAQPISSFPEDYRWWGQGMIGPVPVPVIIFLAIAVIAAIILRNAKYGRRIYAIGGNQQASRLSGLNVDRLLLSVYVINGLLAGLAGFLLSARLNSAQPTAGVGYELTVIAGVVLGGTSLSGGEGTIFGTVIGTVLIGVLSNGLTLLNVSPFYQQILIGLIIVFAVFFDQWVKRRRR